MGLRFQNKEIGEAVAVRGAGPESVRIWLRATRPGDYRVCWWEEGFRGNDPEEGDDPDTELVVNVSSDRKADYTHSFSVPGPKPALKPMTRYQFRITHAHDGRLLGEGRFETAPAGPEDAPSSFSFAIMSCNQPFDSEGRIRLDAREMLRAARSALEEHDCKFVLMMGDQMYADMPLDLSLFDEKYFANVAPPGRSSIHECTVDEVRSLYQHRYRHFGSIPELRDLVSNFPCYTIVDDHDIVDNWGSDPHHRSNAWQVVGEGARWAYFDYQADRIESHRDRLPTSFHYEIDYGYTSTFVMDLRSERWVDSDSGRLLSEDQYRDLESFLDRTRDRKAIFLVLSVPPVHLPRYLAATAARLSQSGEDFSDRWSSLAHVDDRDRFLKRIREHRTQNPDQRVIFLSGDIHVGCAHELRWDDGSRPVYQLISSGLTNRVGKPIQMGARLLMRLNRRVDSLDGELRIDVRLIRGVDGRSRNPYADLNIGIVRVSTEEPDEQAAIEYFIYGHRGSEPVLVFQSPRI